MDQGITTSDWLNHRASLLERYDARRAAYTEPNYQWNFRAAVSCPPSTVIHMRGGQVWGDPEDWGGIQWYVDSASYDLADANDTGYSYVFTNAYYYKPLSVMLRYSGNPDSLLPTDPRLLILTSGEQATAALAEQAAYPQWPAGAMDPDAYYGIPLGIFIVRNNGNTTLPNQFQPVDRVNRGRSYLFRDVKLRYQW